MTVALGGRAVPVALVRDGWRGRAVVASVAADRYAELAARWPEFLGPRERDAFAGLIYERRRTSYLLGRYAAKLALTDLVGLADGRAIDVVPGCFQQPVVLAPADVPVGVSISHTTGGAWAVAFPDEHPMGIDAEAIDAARVEVMQSQFTAREIDAVGRLGGDAALSVVVWTAKEALSKVLRCGLTVPFSLLEVDELDRRGADASGVFPNFHQYRFESRLQDGTVVSLVLPRRTRLGDRFC